MAEYIRSDNGGGLGPEYLAWIYHYDQNGRLEMVEDRAETHIVERFSQFTRLDVVPWKAFLYADRIESDVYTDPNGPPNRSYSQITRFSDTEQVTEGYHEKDGLWKLWLSDSIRYSSSGIQLFRSQRTSSGGKHDVLDLHYDSESRIDSATAFLFGNLNGYYHYYWNTEKRLDSVVITNPYSSRIERFVGFKWPDNPLPNRPMEKTLLIVRDEMLEYVRIQEVDGVIVSSDTFSRAFDARGRMTHDYRPTVRFTYSYFEEDDEISEWTDSRLRNGEWEIVDMGSELRTYDADGRLVERRDGDDNPRYIRRLVYSDQASIVAEHNENVRFFPNPADSYITIGLERDGDPTIVTITDALGREVLRQQLTTQQVDVNSLPPGRYLVQILRKGVIIGSPFIKLSPH